MALLDDLKNKRAALIERVAELEGLRKAGPDTDGSIAQAIARKKAGIAELDAAIKAETATPDSK